MTLSAPVQKATEELEALVAQLSGGTGLTVRLLKIIKNVLAEWTESKSIEEAHSLTDLEVLRKFAVSGALISTLESREAKKLARRAEAKIFFFEALEKHGGVIKTQAVTKILQVTRQSVNNYVKKRSLVAIQEGNDYCYPAFQFDEGKKLPHLEKILEALGDKSAESICTFFLNPISISGRENTEYPYVLLRGNPPSETLQEILREAQLFMSGTPS